MQNTVMIYKLQSIFRISNREIARLCSINNGKLLSLLDEVCKGLHVIRAFGREQYMEEQYISKITNSISSSVLSESLYSWLQCRLFLISNLLFASTLLCTIIILVADINISFHNLALFITYTLIVTQYFQHLIENICQLEHSFVSVERMRQYYEKNEQEDLEVVLNNQIVLNEIQSSETQEQQAIIFKQVYLSYDEGQTFALKDFNLQIKKGEKIAICGRTGSGKTSILNILFRLYQIGEGSVYIKGKEIRSLSLSELRQSLNIIPQFGFLYNASLKDNLDPNDELSNDQLAQIIKESGLNITKNWQKQTDKKINQIQKENIGDLEDGSRLYDEYEELQEENESLLNTRKNRQAEEDIIDVDYEIEEAGGNLSNGEKQIINFLRVIIKNKDIICLDEATSNMDPKTDQILHDKLFQFSENKTLIVITHRLENIDKFDRVIVMKKGKIVEQGKYLDLKQIENGFFNKMFQK